jgi:hypothetical protein
MIIDYLRSISEIVSLYDEILYFLIASLVINFVACAIWYLLRGLRK